MKRQTTRSASSPLDVLSECLGYQSLRTARALTSYYNNALKPLELQGTQLSLLIAIQSNPGTSLASLGNTLATDPSTLVRNVAVLRTRGLVHSGATRGRSGKQLRTTPEGDVMIAQALPIWQDAFSRLKHRLGEQNAERILESLRDLEAASERPKP
ncbi:MarR family winged helix-turn-helix transcriptional regulator [Agrobacterium fabrum]|uniref:MarR family winged helix-turn-helix transcriptional regulator n=1 Tax=Agrobacterium fabrum TaxID=1176649 RepID=UPI001574EADD|nr:MarR family winged helix-turn-helix transcriptional regulator [Agrobacterium fabrum]WCK80179.1 MarR family winged helix-turn-helix transcriptional regulator [Agrobacterium fabrum]